MSKETIAFLFLGLVTLLLVGLWIFLIRQINNLSQIKKKSDEFYDDLRKALEEYQAAESEDVLDAEFLMEKNDGK